MIRVRFHLGAGKHFKQWQITHHDGSVKYHDPNYTTLTIWQGRLRNQQATAERIHAGANKKVCAWIEAERVDVEDGRSCVMGGTLVHYNPRLAPHWVINNQNADGRRFPVLTTAGSSVFTTATPAFPTIG